MKTLLLYVPITDPTSGYHSLSYISAFAKKEGFNDIHILDTNIEALHYTIKKENVKKIQSTVNKKFEKLINRTELSAIEQMQLYYAWSSNFISYSDIEKAIKILQTENFFYDYKIYRPAVEVLSNWLNTLSVLAFPGMFRNGFNLVTHSFYNLFNVDDMCSDEVLEKISRPFIGYYKDILLPFIQENEYKVIGINITYVSQLPFAVYLGKLIKIHFPNIKLLYGGTEVADVWKYLNKKSMMFKIFEVADALIVGEGESAFVNVLKMFNKEKYFPVSNLVLHPKYQVEIKTNVPIKYEDVSNLPLPDYEQLDWSRYLSPHSFIYYSPSRGCYWNKCTFCDYGLNFNSPTSPWRQYSLEKIVSDLKEITKHHKFVYLSVDVLAPAMLLKLAKRIIEEKIDMRWGAEIRLETYWSIERCQLLKDSGCTVISVGFESGNQRILDLINKGTKVEKIKETIQRFTKVGIGVQMMGFTGFPTETFEDAMDSVNFLKENREYWTFGGLGEFVLTRGAIVAQKPDEFKITNVRGLKGEDVSWRLKFDDTTGGHGEEQNKKRINKAKDSLRLNHLERPWLGGIDTPHTMFYHDKYENSILDLINMEKNFDINNKKQQWILNGIIKDDIPGYPVESLFKEEKLINYYKEAEKEGFAYNSTQLKEVLKEEKLCYNKDYTNKKYYIRTDGKVFPFPPIMIDLLAKFETKRTIQEVISLDSNGEILLQLIEHCVKHHFIKPVITMERNFNKLKEKEYV
ncbi:radical SAM protein [Caldibacillus thermoamylovorans]|nr:radical SAM protein [Caldibacillus thermoamylovorans]